jgi:hypothetical protein
MTRKRSIWSSHGSRGVRRAFGRRWRKAAGEASGADAAEGIADVVIGLDVDGDAVCSGLDETVQEVVRAASSSGGRRAKQARVVRWTVATNCGPKLKRYRRGGRP